MPKTTFIRKPCTLEDVREGTKWIKSRHEGQPIDSYYIAEEIQLDENAFRDLCNDLFSSREWVAAFSNRQHHMRGDAVAAIRVTSKGTSTVLIIDPQGYSYPRYVGLGEAPK